MHQRGSTIPAFLLVLLAVAAFAVLLYVNARPAPEMIVLIPTEPSPTDASNAWQDILRQGFGSNSTPLPTIAIPATQFVPPTLASSGEIDTTPVAPEEVTSDVTATEISFVMTPTRPAPTPAPLATDVPVTAQVVTRPPSAWQPPPLIPPISRDPYGRDHYWFTRPVDSDAANYGLSYYPFGSDGNEEFSLRVHHGIDMSNPIGETVRAAGSGTVIWAADGLRTEGGVFENSPAYGNVVVIEHDFGYRGEKLWTIYAHLSAALVMRDEHVEAGDAIGLVGNTGRVTGPHVHFEVRLGEMRYAANYNPVLWMVPYVGHGVIAGRVLDSDGNRIDDADITIRNWGTGLVEDTTTTYLYQGTAYDVNADPIWQENFAIGDIPTGRYEVIASINGLRVSRIVDVLEGTTSFVELSPSPPSTQQASADGS
jgi:murein DD-endopeptidase MepM/ murein hydrolase activator NlpD